MQHDLDDIGGARELAWHRINAAKEVVSMVEQYFFKRQKGGTAIWNFRSNQKPLFLQKIRRPADREGAAGSDPGGGEAGSHSQKSAGAAYLRDTDRRRAG